MTHETTTPLVINALLRQIVDYAGLFPPARLDMATTVANYGRYVDGDDAWMLGRLVIPVDRLDEFLDHAAPLLPRSAEREPWHISGLTAAAGDDRLGEQIDRIQAFNATHADAASGLARIDVVELRASEIAAIEEALDALPDEIYPFFELPVENDVRGLLAALVGSDGGAKVRTGGPTREHYPSPEDLGRFVERCAAAHVPFKATAGLHHPLRHHSASVGVEEFGFLNVFVAAALVMQRSIEGPEVVAALTEQDPSAFTFEDRTLRYRDHELGAEEIARARERFAISFGSCSFDEPRDDLRAMGLL